jgi:LysM repeat protein
MLTVAKALGLVLLLTFWVACAGGGGSGRAGSEIPSSSTATTSEPLPERQDSGTVGTPYSGISASRSEPIIYDYPGATRNLNAPNPASTPSSSVVAAAPPTPTISTSGGATITHTVQSGDTLWGISRKYQVTVDALRAANGMVTDVIKPGQTLRIP